MKAFCLLAQNVQMERVFKACDRNVAAMNAKVVALKELHAGYERDLLAAAMADSDGEEAGVEDAS